MKPDKPAASRVTKIEGKRVHYLTAIPKDGSDMKTAAIRVHALAKSLGVTKARVVGHDIGLMVAYAYAAQFSAEVEKLIRQTWRTFSRTT